MKVRFDGSESMLVASRFASLVKMTNRHVFYMSASGDLRVVRNDGNDDKRIAAGVKGTHVIIDDAHVFYLKRDYIGPKDGDENGLGYSLYSTDLEGKNLHKIAHDITAMQEYNDRYLYICKHRDIKYAIKTPLTKRSSRTDVIDREIIYYEIYDKKRGEFKEIVHFGVPVPTSITYKKSWWPFSHKMVTKFGSVDQIDTVFQRDDVAMVGKIRNEELEREHMKLELIERDRIAKEIAKAEKKAAKKARKAEKKAEKLAKKEAKKEKKEAKKAAKEANTNAADDELMNNGIEAPEAADSAPEIPPIADTADFSNEASTPALESESAE